MSNPKITGTKEWSVESVNIVLGCPHRCRYCYAAARAVDYGQCPTREAWGTTYHRVRPGEATRRRKKAAGRVMFPTTHDITPEFLQPCLDVLDRLLSAGNDVLVVSKPQRQCIKTICDRFFGLYREAILFRFTIGAKSDSILGYWEPGAPNFADRLASLKYAFDQGFATSVSCEPLLDAPRSVELFRAIVPWVSDTIWIGKMNQIRTRCVGGTDESEIRRIEAGQTDAAVRAIYQALKYEPKVRWKESYKTVLGLALAETAGLDV